MLNTRSFENLSGGQKIPHLKQGVMNLLRVVDIPEQDRLELFKMGFGDLTPSS
jgi:hypothetical protein